MPTLINSEKHRPMVIRDLELTMSHLGLGCLTEYAALVLFGDAHSHRLTKGLPTTPDQIEDGEGRRLYPAYFMTHLRVPPHRLLADIKLWDRVQVGIDVHRFGETLMDSHYILTHGDSVPEDVAHWSNEAWPTMRANNLMVIDVSEEGAAKRVAVPHGDSIAALPKLRRPPEAILKAKKIRTNGFDWEENLPPIACSAPLTYRVHAHRDAAPGRAMIFAKFSEIMDLAERDFLNRELQPGFPAGILDHLHLLERETFYYGNCFAGETLAVHLQGHMMPCPMDFHGDSLTMTAAATTHFHLAITNHRTQELLAMARVRKLLALPAQSQDGLQDVRRLMEHHWLRT